MKTLKRFLGVDWDAVAGILAALAALVLHLLHIVEAEALLALALVLLALLLVRDLRRERQQDLIAERVERTESAVSRVQAALHAPDAVLVGPSQLRLVSSQFAGRAVGEMRWFNVCLLMFKPQTLFDVLLRPAIENPRITSIQFILDEGEKQHWLEVVLPKVTACSGHEKVRQPIWCALRESVSFITAETGPDGAAEMLLSFWGEPFMARSTERDLPRYLFHVQPHSELVTRLGELERTYRVGK
jgi:hypothetical protein